MRKLRLISLIYWFSILVANAQATFPEKLLSQIKVTKSDTGKINLRLQLGNYYLNKRGEHKNNLDSAIACFNMAMQLSVATHSPAWENATLVSQGNYYIKAGDVSRAKSCFDTVIYHYRKLGDKKNEALTWKQFADSFNAEKPATNGDQLKCYENARVLFIETGDKLHESKVLESIANIHLDEKKFDLAQAELLQALNQYKLIGYKKLQNTYDLLGDLNKLKADLHKELFYRISAVNSMEEEGDSSRAAYYYSKIALIYTNLNAYSQSIDWITKSLQILKKHDPEADFYGDMDLLILDMIRQGKPQEAINYLNKVSKEVPPVNLAQKVDLNEEYGNAYRALKQFDKAEQYYLNMMQIYQLTYNSKDLYSTQFQMVSDFVHYNLTMSEFYLLIKRYPKAKIYLDRILSLPRNQVRPSPLIRVYHGMFQVDSALGNYILAIRHFETYKKLQDSMYDVTKSHQIADMMVKYETDKKEQSIRILKTESKSQNTELQKVHLERNITLGGIIMLVIILGLTYIGYRNKRRNNMLLQSKQEKINRQNKSLQLLLRDKDELLAEKDWLLREIHHRVKNNLQIVMSLLNTQSAYLESNAAITAIRESQNRVQAISLIHQKLYSTSNVASIDMYAYISDLVNYLRDCLDTIDSRIRFEISVDDIRIDLAQAVPLGLILNEAITNAIKYAFGEKGGSIDITLRWLGDENLLLTVSDNGIGLPQDFDIANATSLGMEMMKALSKQLGGAFRVKNRSGVEVSIEFYAEKILHALHV